MSLVNALQIETLELWDRTPELEIFGGSSAPLHNAISEVCFAQEAHDAARQLVG